MSIIITKAELARWAGVSRMAVSKATSKGKPLFDAVIKGKVQADHPLVREWLATHGVVELPSMKQAKTTKKTSKRKPARSTAIRKPTSKTNKKKQKAEEETTELPDYEPPELQDLTVREVVMRYGTIDGFKRYVDSLKSIAEYKYREIRIQQSRGELIEREKVAGAIFPLIDVAFARLVTDVPTALGKQIIARVESGGDDTVADVQRLIRDTNSRVLKSAKAIVSKLEILNDTD